MSHIDIAKNGGITTVTISRPDAMNALTRAMHHDLQAAFDDFASDDGQHVCVITGAGDRAFCAGSDLKEASQGSIGGGEYPESGYAGLIERFDCPKPFVAAVNGLALGGGFEIALACDIIIASEIASFGLPEPLVGAVALGGGVHRLIRQIGEKQAMGLLLTARRIDAAEAHRLGIVNSVVAADNLAAEIARWCDEMRKCSPMALRATKATALRGLGEASLANAIRAQKDYPEFAEWRSSDDAREGPLAFAEKRAPKWA